ncbi:rhodanese-related sulfurtransferase [Buchnera aphidicola]|uniref:tRNA uridine(34) hydroxylase n=1 Tax=Buchnera aphidicola (Anoecia oenotherae) TaxID=1241833 RepID=A0A4D6XRH0_9GAMM|nr:rhodanese-related sulfurtransferase [Buchnera aphidicola]QCI19406.1 rhodanese-related sulfurtransferase [Buchnera aphidicola (Anoecia oenotherae)]
MNSKLNNTFCKKDLKKKATYLQHNRITISFYKYFYINNPVQVRNELYLYFFKYNVFGRIYISTEGVNAQISVPYRNFVKVKHFIYNLHRNLKNIYLNIAIDNKNLSFWMLKIKVRKKLVSDGIYIPNFNNQKKGIYLNFMQVNKRINDPNTIFVDVRNNYEYKVGHFKGSVRIPGDTFKQQINNSVSFLNKFKKKNIVMYCTGGIRCEIATSWMLFNGFKKIYHILGGIIRYVNDSNKKNCKINFLGSNFVFDDRMIEKITQQVLSYCYNCKKSSDKYKNCINNFCHKLFIQCDLCANQLKSYCSLICMNNHNKEFFK